MIEGPVVSIHEVFNLCMANSAKRMMKLRAQPWKHPKKFMSETMNKVIIPWNAPFGPCDYWFCLFCTIPVQKMLGL